MSRDASQRPRLISNKYDCCGKLVHTKRTNCCKRTKRKCCNRSCGCSCNCEGDYISTDVIVVGSGLAGTMAMVAADREGAKVIMLEAEGSLGGTTLQSGSTIWIPNLTKTFDMATAIDALGLPMIGKEYDNLPGGFDIKGPALEYMSSCVYPELYTTSSNYLGMPANIYHLIDMFYDKTQGYLEDEVLPYIDSLRVAYNAMTGTNYKPMIYNTNMHSLQSGFTLTQSPAQTFTAVADPVVPDTFGQIRGYCYSVNDEAGYFSMEPDYYDKTVKPGTCVGRQIQFVENNEDGTFGDINYGGEYLKRIWSYLRTVSNQQILTGQRVMDVEETDKGILVTAINVAAGTVTKYLAKKGIVFGSGGFSHNNDYIQKHLMYTQILGSCSSNGCRGDLVEIAEKNKWELTQMKHAFYNQQTMNDIGTNTQSIQWFLWYSTVMVINKFGNRVFSETGKYNERAKAHFSWDTTRSYFNQYLFMVMDRSDYNRHASSSLARSKTFSVNDNNIPINTKIATICTEIKNWFASLPNLSEFVVDDVEMATGFMNTIQKYHSYCSTGIDLDFGRQNNDSGRHWLGFGKFVGGQFIDKNTIITQDNDWRFNSKQIFDLYGANGQAYFESIANYEYTYPDGSTYKICRDITMQPIIDPVVMILIPTTLDTKGGPLINEDFKIAYSKGAYVAGNAGGSSFTAMAYWGAGGTLGPALFGGWTAGKAAAENNYGRNQDNKFGSNLNIVNLMDNDYPDRTIALDFNDPIDFVIVVKKEQPCAKILFKLSTTINESIPKNDCVHSYADWLLLDLIRLDNDDDCYAYYRIILPPNTFVLPGQYLISFQMINFKGCSLGPKYADQRQMTVTQFNNINNYTYIENPLPTGSLLLNQVGAAWPGKFRVNTITGFPEVVNGNNIYISYHHPSHNFNLTYAYEFGTLQEVIDFGNLVYSNPSGIAYDAANLPPGSPIPVVNLPYYSQPWFDTHYDVANNGQMFPNNEVSTFAYISTHEIHKNWYFNTAYTNPGKYTVYFFYCSPHRTTSLHIGWMAVFP